jgi:hypothetical protein
MLVCCYRLILTRNVHKFHEKAQYLSSSCLCVCVCVCVDLIKFRPFGNTELWVYVTNEPSRREHQQCKLKMRVATNP